jgi:hypothetical protein
MSAALSNRWAQLTGHPFMTMADNVERRKHRRHDLEMLDLPVEREASGSGETVAFGTVVDLSAGGIRVKAVKPGVQAGAQVRVKLNLPNSAGISPFIDHEHDCKPATEWSGWMHVTRVSRRSDGHFDVAGRLMDMNDVDRGMLGLYLSTQPLAT